jgi:hypothetical protein
MRTALLGFFLGYLLTTLLVLPSLLWGVQAVPSYGQGVTVVLDRTGVLDGAQHAYAAASEARDLLLQDVQDYVESRLRRTSPVRP